MRFTKQKNKYDCSAVAIINACKHFGQKISYTKYKNDLADLLNLTEQGCKTGYFINLMSRIHKMGFFKIKTTSIGFNLKPSQISVSDKQIAMILTNGHVFVLTEIKNKTYKCVNLYSNRTISHVRKKRFTKLLKTGNVVLTIEGL